MAVVGNPNRILIAVVQFNAAVTLNSVTWNGTNLTHLAAADAVNGTMHTQLWYLIAPQSGTFNLIATCSGDMGASGLGAFSLYNVDQTTGVQTGTNANGSSGAYSIPITPTVQSSWILMGLGGSSGAPGTISGGTEDYTNNVNAYLRGAHNANPTIGSSNTISYPGPAAGPWAISGCEVLAHHS